VARVRFTEDARLDLIEIDAFGAERFGDEVAEAYQRGIDDVVTQLEDFPLLGEARPDYGLEIRCMVHKSHRILYQINGDLVVIARILHHSRDAARHLKP